MRAVWLVLAAAAACNTAVAFYFGEYMLGAIGVTQTVNGLIWARLAK